MTIRNISYSKYTAAPRASKPKMSVDYLLHESSVGYAIFKVVHQVDTVGNRLKEVQDSVQVGAQCQYPYTRS